MSLLSHPALRRFLPALIALLLIVAVGTVYSQVLRFDFVAWDDDQIIYADPIYNPPTQDSIIPVWQRPHLNLYIPVTYSLWGLLAKLSWQEDSHIAPMGVRTHLTPGPFHAANFLLHIGCVLLVFAILRRSLHSAESQKDVEAGASENKTQGDVWRDLAAGCGALFFALHPVQAEAVAWISELKGMLGSFWVLAALWQFLISLQSEAPARRRLHAVLAAACYVLALLSKPAAVPAPLMALVLGRFVSNHSWSELARRLWFWWLVAIAGALVARWAQTISLGVPWWWRPFIAGDTLTFYLGKLAWPHRLAIHYGRTPWVVMEHSWAYFMWLIPALFAFLLWRTRRPVLRTGMLLFIAPLLPVLGLVTFVYQNSSTTADRYLFVSLLSPALLLAYFLARRPRPIFFGAAMFYIAILGVLSYRQTATWANSHTLMEHTIATNPHSWVARSNLGLVIESESGWEAARSFYYRIFDEPSPNAVSLDQIGMLLGQHSDYGGAEKALRRALEIAPNYGESWSNLGTLYAMQGRPAQAVDAYKRASQLLKDSADVQTNLGLSLAALQRTDEAIAAYQQALRLRPNHPETLYNLGLAHANQKDYAPAQAAFTRAAQIKPDYWAARHALGLTLRLQGKLAEAQRTWQQLLKENPSFEPTLRALQASTKDTKKRTRPMVPANAGR